MTREFAITDKRMGDLKLDNILRHAEPIHEQLMLLDTNHP
jgi:hypothetical protein